MPKFGAALICDGSAPYPTLVLLNSAGACLGRRGGDEVNQLTAAAPASGAVSSLPGRRRRLAPVGDISALDFGILSPVDECCRVPGSADIPPIHSELYRKVALACQLKVRPSLKSLGAKNAGTTNPSGLSALRAENSEASSSRSWARVGDGVRNSS